MHKYINKDNSRKECGMSIEDLLSLSGIFGIHPELKMDIDLLGPRGRQYKIPYLIYFKCEKKFNFAEIEFETEYLKALQVSIDLTGKVIENRIIESTEKKTKISLPRLASQVFAARRLGFHTIYCDAFGGEKFEKFVGHIVWGKYGYQMSNEDHENFLQLMAVHHRCEKSIHELLQTPDGVKLWADVGKSWFAVFQTDENSISSLILNQCLTEAKIITDSIT